MYRYSDEKSKIVGIVILVFLSCILITMIGVSISMVLVEISENILNGGYNKTEIPTKNQQPTIINTAKDNWVCTCGCINPISRANCLSCGRNRPIIKEQSTPTGNPSPVKEQSVPTGKPLPVPTNKSIFDKSNVVKNVSQNDSWRCSCGCLNNNTYAFCLNCNKHK